MLSGLLPLTRLSLCLFVSLLSKSFSVLQNVEHLSQMEKRTTQAFNCSRSNSYYNSSLLVHWVCVCVCDVEVIFATAGQMTIIKRLCCLELPP